LQLCRRIDHVETRSPPYVLRIVASTHGFGRARDRLAALRGQLRVAPITSKRLDLVSLGPEFVGPLLDGRREEAEAAAGVKLPDAWPDGHDVGFLSLRLREMREKPELQQWSVRALVLADDPHPMIGHAGFHGPPGRNAVKSPDAVEIGYRVFEPHRRRGYATEAVRALIDWAASEHGIRHFVASIALDNEPSLRLVKNFGFEQTGRHADEEEGEELVFELRLPPAV
jgi:ribosomal-protein-alanine N-acetyltransferase